MTKMIMCYLLVSAAVCQIERELINRVNNMIGGDIEVGHLLEAITTTTNGYSAQDKSSSEIDALADNCIEFKFPFLFKVSVTTIRICPSIE